jgi:hypothetical protein
LWQTASARQGAPTSDGHPQRTSHRPPGEAHRGAGPVPSWTAEQPAPERTQRPVIARRNEPNAPVPATGTKPECGHGPIGAPWRLCRPGGPQNKPNRPGRSGVAPGVGRSGKRPRSLTPATLHGGGSYSKMSQLADGEASRFSEAWDGPGAGATVAARGRDRRLANLHHSPSLDRINSPAFSPPPTSASPTPGRPARALAGPCPRRDERARHAIG